MIGAIMFKPGQTVICVDETDSYKNRFGDRLLLQEMKQYIVEDYCSGFVKLEAILGEWHETRFILASSYAA